MRNKRKLAAVARKTLMEDPANGQSQNTSVPGINEENITQVSEAIEGRVTKNGPKNPGSQQYRVPHFGCSV